MGSSTCHEDSHSVLGVPLNRRLPKPKTPIAVHLGPRGLLGLGGLPLRGPCVLYDKINKFPMCRHGGAGHDSQALVAFMKMFMFGLCLVTRVSATGQGAFFFLGSTCSIPNAGLSQKSSTRMPRKLHSPLCKIQVPVSTAAQHLGVSLEANPMPGFGRRSGPPCPPTPSRC